MKNISILLMVIVIVGCNNVKPKTRIYRTVINGIHYICDDFTFISKTPKLLNCKEDLSSFIDIDSNPVTINIVNATNIFEVVL
jgi:hypothetical protein